MMKLTYAIVLALITISCSHGRYHKNHHSKGHGGSHSAMWKMLDADGNGSLTKEEFDKGHAEFFKKADTDANGEISKEEMHAAHRANRASCPKSPACTKGHADCAHKKHDCKDKKACPHTKDCPSKSEKNDVT